MMSGMGPRRLRAAGAVVAAVVLVAAACTADEPPDDPDDPPRSASLRVETVSGADRLDERARADLEGEVGEVLSQYLVDAFLGDFPRQRFVQSFASFTSGAAEDATRDIDWLTAATVQDATSVRATELDARLSFLTLGRTVHGGTAHVHFAFEAAMPDGSARPLVLDGSFLLEADDDGFTIFGYEVTFDNGDGEQVEVDSGTGAAS
jgi:hypothetical protein